MSPTPVAIVSNPGHEPVISDVDCIIMVGTNTANIERLSRVIDAALSWVKAEYDAQTEAIRGDLLARDYDDLIALPAPTFNTPYEGSVSQPRPLRSG
jgi:hypothetical protein